jgi:hypothetical protein
MNMVAYLHRIVVEVSSVCLIGRSILSRLILKDRVVRSWKRAPHYTAFADETIAADGYDYSMAWTCPSQVSSNDSTTCDDRLATEDDVLRPSDCGPP